VSKHGGYIRAVKRGVPMLGACRRAWLGVHRPPRHPKTGVMHTTLHCSALRWSARPEVVWPFSGPARRRRTAPGLSSWVRAAAATNPGSLGIRLGPTKSALCDACRNRLVGAQTYRSRLSQPAARGAAWSPPASGLTIFRPAPPPLRGA